MPIPVWAIILGAGAITALSRNNRQKKNAEQFEESLIAEEKIEIDLTFSEFINKWFGTTTQNIETQKPKVQNEIEITTSKKFRVFTPLRVTLSLLILSAVLSLPLPESSIFNIELLRTIFFSATVGIGTNYLAIFLLFRPVKKRLGLFQGVIPKKRAQIAKSLASGIQSNLLDEQTIQTAIHESNLVNKAMNRFIERSHALIAEPEFVKDTTTLLVQRAKAFVTSPKYQSSVLAQIAKIAKALPITILGQWVPEIVLVWIEKKVAENKDQILIFINNELEGHIHKILQELQQILLAAPDKYQDQKEALEVFLTHKICSYAKEFDIEQIIYNKLDQMHEDEFYQLINETTENELAYLQYLGAALGGFAGVLLYLATHF